jgi:hypothetical protein
MPHNMNEVTNTSEHETGEVQETRRKGDTANRGLGVVRWYSQSVAVVCWRVRHTANLQLLVVIVHGGPKCF